MSVFSVSEAAKLSRMTPAMVDYLCRQSIIVPSYPKRRGRGRARRYTFGEVVLLRTVEKLLRKGVSVKRLKDALKTKNKFFREIHPEKPPIQVFATDGKSVLIEDPDSKILNLSEGGQIEFSFVIDLRKTHAAVVEDLARVYESRVRKKGSVAAKMPRKASTPTG